MKFDDAGKVWNVVETMRKADIPRATNRARINALFNGNPPYSEEEAHENKIQTNVNFLEAARIAQNARGQFINAFQKPGNYFSVTLDYGPREKRTEWSNIITRQINRIMKASEEYNDCLEAVFAQVVLHGVGPVTWDDRECWCPTEIGIEDFLVPSNTKQSLRNLDHFAIYRRYTPGELYRKTHSPTVDKGWNIKLVEQVLAQMSEDEQASQSTTNWDDWRFPEKVEEDFKSNPGFWESDAVPTINCWDFYFEDEGKWYRRMVMDGNQPTSSSAAEVLAATATTTATADQDGKTPFLYTTGDRPYCADRSELMHVQFGNIANVGPFRYHSVRSLGFMLYAVCHLSNRLRCRLMDHAFENLMMLFRNVPVEDRERMEAVLLYHMGIVPQGVEVVPAVERHQINSGLVGAVMSQMRQLMAESSSSFTQDVNDGTSKQLTATETMARINTANALVGSMLTKSYTKQQFQYFEICRRFCIADSKDKDVQAFRRRCLRDGVPPEALDVEKWNIEPERALGNGSKTLEIVQADRLMSVRGLLPPEAQREVTHMYIEANSDDPKLAERLVPSGDETVSSTTIFATLAFGALMQGIPVPAKPGTNAAEYAGAILLLLERKIREINTSTGAATAEQIAGFVTAVQSVEEHLATLAEDKDQKERLKAFMAALREIMKQVREFAERFQSERAALLQAQGQGAGQGKGQVAGGIAPEVLAQLQESRLLAVNKAQIEQAKAAQDLRQNMAKFVLDEQRKNAETAAEIRRENLKTLATL